MPRELVVRIGAAARRVRVVSEGAVEIDGRRVALEVRPVDESTLVVETGGARHTVHVAIDGERTWAMCGGEAFVIEPAATEPAAGEPVGGGPDASIVASGSAAGGADLSAPMPATVTAVLVRPGDRVAAGDPVVRLEAMKMELVVAAPRAGRIATVDCQEGELAQPGRPLVTLEDAPNGSPGAR